MADPVERPKVGPAPIEVQRAEYAKQKAEAIAYDKEGLYAPKPAPERTVGSEMARGILAAVKGRAYRAQVIEDAVDEAAGDNDRLRQNQSTDQHN